MKSSSYVNKNSLLWDSCHMDFVSHVSFSGGYTGYGADSIQNYIGSSSFGRFGSYSSSSGSYSSFGGFGGVTASGQSYGRRWKGKRAAELF